VTERALLFAVVNCDCNRFRIWGGVGFDECVLWLSEQACSTKSRVARFFSAKITKTGGNIPNNQQIYQMVINYTKCLYNRQNDNPLPLQAPQNYTNWGFGFENIPSCNTAKK
jgi:hypothetical protein